jgi:alpha-tubulin suppressor-like RCC1 family protein
VGSYDVSVVQGAAGVSLAAWRAVGVGGWGGGGVQVVLTRSHELYAIGRNTEGQLGMGDVEQQPTPKPVVPPLASVRTSTLGSLD